MPLHQHLLKIRITHSLYIKCNSQKNLSFQLSPGSERTRFMYPLFIRIFFDIGADDCSAIQTKIGINLNYSDSTQKSPCLIFQAHIAGLSRFSPGNISCNTFTSTERALHLHHLQKNLTRIRNRFPACCCALQNPSKSYYTALSVFDKAQ